MRRKGEFSEAQLHRDYRFQVAFPEEHARDLLRGGQFYPSCAPMTASTILEGKRHVIVAFSDEADLLAFMGHAGGVRVEPKLSWLAKRIGQTKGARNEP
ncbi:hypothetical protein J2X65_002058 [Ancylobacter sp. 3268]|uniref:hypothetical protein n=1 Tax=Ancylobacter sp. 3268 TaxID=2817752 RepID=UPI002863A0F7|nr:hypothetical protein [Ancylobacter sp. 3268]MDR6952699.1 hypothetical protein [Ancylobacter sp. 3268]